MVGFAAALRQRGYIVSIGFGIVSQPHTLEAIAWSTGGMAGADGHQSESAAHKWKNIRRSRGMNTRQMWLPKRHPQI